MMKKFTMAIVLLLAFIVGSGTQVFAGIYLDSGAKWASPSSIKYMNTSTKYKTLVNDGALNFWNNYTNDINFVQTNDATITKKILVYDVNYPSLSWDGQTVTTANSGYLSKAEIKLNVSNIEEYTTNVDKIRYRVINHEFGHTLGLGDLYTSSEDDVLMYGYTRATPYYPTNTDITRLNNLY